MGVEVGAYKGARKQAFLMALRLAWRDARKHKGRSALIVALIALPVAGMTMVALLITSSQMTAQERIDTELGTAQAVLMPGVGGGFVQMPTEPHSGVQVSAPDSNFVARTPLEAAPSGYKKIVEQTGQLELAKGKVPVFTQIRTTELFEPAFSSRFDLVEGSQEEKSDAVYLSTALSLRMDLSVGDELKVGSDSYPIAGIIREKGWAAIGEIVYALPGHPLSEASQGAPAAHVYLLGDNPLTWPEIKELNAVGVSALSRAVLLDPPDASEVPNSAIDYQTQSFLTGMVAISVIGSLVLAEVGLLAGAAFAVGAKGQRRMLALLAAAGGEKSTIRFIVTASGVVLGAIGVVVGAILGIAAAAAWVVWHLSNYSPAFPGFHLTWWPIGIFACLGFLASVIAALVPGSAIARQNVFTAVKSAHSASRPARRIPRAGLACLGAAIVFGGTGVWLAFAAADGEEAASRALFFVPLMALGTLFFISGLLACTGRIVDLIARAASRAPTSVRMAARDASRNRSRAVPAVAAVLAATSVAAIVMVGSATAAYQAQFGQSNNIRDLQGSVRLVHYNEEDGSLSSIDPTPAAVAVEKVMGSVGEATVVSGVEHSCPLDGECTYRRLELPAANTCAVRIAEETADPATCRDPFNGGNAGLPQFVADDVEAVTAIFGHAPSQEVVTALKSGKMVVLNPAWIEGGHVTILEEWWDPETGKPGETERIRVEAVAATGAPNLGLEGIISPSTAEGLGFEIQESFVVMDLPRQPTNAIADEINAELIETMGYQSTFMFQFPGPPVEEILWAICGIAALVALTSAAITAGLALADGRSDHVTLAGIGAAPALRKRLAAAQTALGASLGVVLGMVGGLVPAAAVLAAVPQYQLIIPWPQLLALVVLVPLIGAGSAWLFTRARLPMTRRALLE
ncbi:hypothetical protein GCM10027404_34100 [Arthrobacter tumbae]|uniref:FtsX-like permease family protein n=1 Tax=Arthrobacter tumbae TaxID=163874 RepID=UPI001957739C|nr:FtsX-like permease family protein [Arthrobacter tumbae]MBM7782006.1 putative ABC transport system permease protein [Arthrobacter tumbae]